MTDDEHTYLSSLQLDDEVDAATNSKAMNECRSEITRIPQGSLIMMERGHINYNLSTAENDEFTYQSTQLDENSSLVP